MKIQTPLQTNCPFSKFAALFSATGGLTHRSRCRRKITLQMKHSQERFFTMPVGW
jgi:hypothetical protein